MPSFSLVSNDEKKDLYILHLINEHMTPQQTDVPDGKSRYLLIYRRTLDDGTLDHEWIETKSCAGRERGNTRQMIYRTRIDHTSLLDDFRLRNQVILGLNHGLLNLADLPRYFNEHSGYHGGELFIPRRKKEPASTRPSIDDRFEDPDEWRDNPHATEERCT
mgnify:CR=1 FL=1